MPRYLSLVNFIVKKSEIVSTYFPCRISRIEHYEIISSKFNTKKKVFLESDKFSNNLFVIIKQTNAFWFCSDEMIKIDF